MMMSSYEFNIGQVRKSSEEQAADDGAELNLLKSLCYCMIPNDGVDDG